MTPRPDAGRPDFIEAVFTCRGNFYDPNFPNELEVLNRRLQTLLKADKQNLVIKKVEPWNSVKVTVNIPKEAAERLKVLAQQNNGAALRNLGIMSLQMEGDRIISLTLKSPTRPVNASTEQLSSFHGSATDSERVSSESHRHNLLTNAMDASRTIPHLTKSVTMHLPVDKVPPLVLNKSKLEKRQRKPTSSKSRSKSKSNTSISSNTNSSQSASATVLVEAESNSELIEQTNPSSTSPVLMHPALKDTELPVSSNLSDQETVNGLLSTLFKRSLDPNNKPSGKSLTSSLPPQSAKKRRLLQHSGQLNHTQSIAATSSPTVSTSTNFTLRPSTAISDDDRPTSEHVSVIARAQTTNIQTEAMDLSGPGNPYFNKPKSPVVLPMDLSDPCSKTPTLSQNLNNNPALHKKLAEPPDSVDKQIFAFSGGTFKESSADRGQSSAQLSRTKATSVIDSKSVQVSRADSECTRLTTPTDSSQLLVVPGISCHAAETEATGRQSAAAHSEVTNGRASIVHGKPVSVICSPMDDRTKSNSMSSNSPDDKHSLYVGTDANRYKDKNSLIPLGSVIVQPASSDTNGSHVSNAKASTIPETDTIANSFCTKYDGPTPHHLSTADHEPIENGSSTSTDSGVVAGSPKSDICATPPAVEEDQGSKSQPPHSNNPVLVNTAALKDMRLLRVAAPSSNTAEKHSQPSVATLDGSTLVINTSRPSVSILRPVKPLSVSRTPGHSKSMTSPTSAVSLVKPRDPHTVTTHKLTQLPHTSVPKDLSYLASSQDAVSDVFLASTTPVSRVAPIRVTLTSNKDRPVIKQHIENSHTITSMVYSGNKTDSLGKKSAGNSDLDEVQLPNAKHRIVHELLGNASGTEPSVSVVSTNHHGSNKGDALNLSTSLLKERLATSSVTLSTVCRDGLGSTETKPSVGTEHVNPPSKTTTVIMSTRTGTSLPVTSVHRNAQEVPTTTTHNLNSIVTPITTQKSIPAGVASNSHTISHPITTTNNASLTQHKGEQPHSVGEGGVNSQLSHDFSTHKLSGSELDSFAHASLDNVPGRQLVNGTSDCGGSECTDVMGSSEAMSPESFTSGCASLEADIPGTEPPGHFSGIAASQPRKSGRVRTLKSPDPDYVTPKARKRGSRASEGSNNSDVSGSVKKNNKTVVALLPGHTEEPVTEPLAALNVNPATQMNGPTSQAKRSTRSSGHSDLQALPTVYRERKRSKR
ncbi:serine-rich adhesin for platelets-like isoform X2 [Watersipora subatra]